MIKSKHSRVPNNIPFGGLDSRLREDDSAGIAIPEGKDLRQWLRHIAILGLVLMVSGCGWLGATYNIFIYPLLPKPTVAAEYDMREQAVLIWVEDVTATQMENARVRRELTEQLREALLEHKAAREIVDYKDIADFRNRHPEFSELSPQELGARFEVDEVLYIAIDEFQLRHEAGEGFYRGLLSGRCKVTNMETGRRVWPTGPTNRNINVTGELTQGQGQAFEDRLVRRLVAKAVPMLAPAFYKHKKQ